MAETELSDKQLIMDRIQANVPVFDRLSSNQYRIRCPFCGDSQKDLKKARLYLKCSDDPSEPILYYCFNDNCNAKGFVDTDFFKKLSIPSDGLSGLEARKYNRLITVKADTVEVITGTPIIPSPQSGYIGYRLGEGLTIDDFDRFKIIWDFRLIEPYIDSKRVANTLPNNRDSVSFLSDDRSVLLIRFFTDDGKYRWKKLRLYHSDARSFYTIKSTVDLLGADRVTINISEGVFDVLSIYKHFNSGDNSVYIGTLGSDYRTAIDHMIAKGIFGEHVDVRVYADGNIDRKDLKEKFRPYRWLFGSIKLLWNTKADDFGVRAESIAPVEISV